MDHDNTDQVLHKIHVGLVYGLRWRIHVERNTGYNKQTNKQQQQQQKQEKAKEKGG